METVLCDLPAGHDRFRAPFRGRVALAAFHRRRSRPVAPLPSGLHKASFGALIVSRCDSCPDRAANTPRVRKRAETAPICLVMGTVWVAAGCPPGLRVRRPAGEPAGARLRR